MTRFIILLAFGLLLPGVALSTHIVGGVMNYECLGNNSYKVTLRVYRDCFNGQAPFDNPAMVGIYNDNGTLIQNFSASNPSITQVPPSINNPCFTAPNSVCVQEAVYVFNITVPNSTSGYHLVYQRCCRNQTILNLTSPGDEGATYSAYIPPQTNGCNDNPVYNNFPPIFVCNNIPFVFDHSATDSDGDSLVYELCTPFSGGTPFNPAPSPPSPPPFPAVNFSTGFNPTYPIASNPAVTLNPQTGVLTLTPNMLGQFVVGVCVSEYRNGQLLSKTLRDFQFNVINCPGIVVASFPGQQTFCDGFNVNFTNNSINANSYLWDFGVNGITSDISTATTPSYTYPGPGTYTVTLIANPNTQCADTATSTFILNPPLNAGFVSPNSQCSSGNNYSFNATGTYSNSATFAWTFGNGTPSSSTLENPSGIAFPGAGTYQVSVTITDGPCVDTHVDQITVLANPMAIIQPQKDFCIGKTVSFNNLSQYSTNFFWDFGDPSTSGDTSTQTNPVYTYTDTGTYTVMLIADNGLCQDTSIVRFDVMPQLEVTIFAPDTEMCINNQWFDFYATGLYDTSSSFLWTFTEGSNVFFSTKDSVIGVQFDSAGVYTAYVSVADYGCVSKDTQNVKVYPIPEVRFDIPGGECNPFTVAFKHSCTSWTPLNFLWDFGDGNTSSEQSPSYTYSVAGDYDVSLTIWSESGCTDTLSVTHKKAVTVYPIPVSEFTVKPEEASIFDPAFKVTDYSQGGSTIVYSWGDGRSTRSSDGIHIYTDTGSFQITQTALNEFGCMDTAIKFIRVYPGHIPNAFTPNGDGNNDFFLPSFTEVQAYKMTIWDRWGEKIFELNSYDKGWDGNYRGVPAKQDMYVYQIEAGSTNGKTYSFTGNLFLIR